MSDVQGAEEVPNESEVEARRLGWVGKEEFKGDPDRWRPADEFLDRGKRILPLVLNDNKKLQRQIDKLELKLQEMSDSTKQVVEFHTQAARREYERGKAEIEARVAAAAANADPAAANAAVKDLEALNKQHAVKTTTGNGTNTQPIDPVIQDWIEKEPWFNKDAVLNSYAKDVYGALEREKPGVSVADLLSETKKLTVDKFPEKFGVNPARETAATVASPNGAGTGRKKTGKTYDDLPADAKAACNKFVKTIPGYSKEKYVADYDWDA